MRAPSPIASGTLTNELVTIATELAGTAISSDTPLMSAGLDSIGASELSTRLSERLGTELSSTLLFDHPSLRSIAKSAEIHDGQFSEQK